MFALVHNDQIQVGPRDWAWSFFKEYLEDEGLDVSELPRRAPESPVVTDDWKILPVLSPSYPDLDPVYEQLAGPYWTIHESFVSGYYDKAPIDIEIVKNKLKSIVTANRYIVENTGVDFTFEDNQTVNIYTNREDRGTYLQAYQLLPDGATITFKFKGEVFRSLTKAELGAIVSAGVAHTQAAFDWEAGKHADIIAAETVEELKLIDLTHPLLPASPYA